MIENGDITVAGYALNDGTLASNATVTASDAFALNNGTVDGTLSGAGALTKFGTGTVTLTGANGYTGGTTVQDGTLALSGNGTLGATSNTTTVNGGTLDLGTTNQTQHALVQNGGVIENGDITVAGYALNDGTLASNATVTASDAFALNNGTVDGTLSGAGALTKFGTGTVTLTGANGYTGGTTVQDGTLALSGNGTLGATSNTTTVNGGTLDLGTTNQTQHALVQNGGVIENGDITVAGYALNDGTLASNATVTASDAFALNNGTVDGTLSGAGALTKSGTGTVTLSGTNDYSGGTTVQDGTLALSGNGTLGAATNTTTVNGGALDLGTTNQTQHALVQNGGTVQNGDMTVDGYMLANGTLAANATVTASAAFALNNGTVDGTLSGTGTLTKSGTGTVTLSGTNDYSGGTTVNSGTVILAGAGTLGATSNTTTVNGGALDLGTTGQAQQALIQNGGVIENGGVTVTDYTLTDGTLAANATVTASDAFNVSNGLIAGTLNGTGKLTKSGTGTVILTGTNDYTGGTTIESGALRLGTGGTTGSITGDVMNNGLLIIDRSDDVDFSNVISGTGSLALIGGGTTTLADANSYSGGTAITAGTSAIGTAASFGSGAIFNNGAVTIDQTQDGVLVNDLEGSGSFVKTGAGNMDMTGGGGFTGSVDIQQGAASVNANYSQADFLIGNGTRLSGTGAVGDLTVDGGAELATGNNGIGTLTVANSLVQQGGSLWSVELGSSGQNDAVHAGGSATIADGAVLDVANVSGGRYALDSAYTVLSAAGGVTGRYTLTGNTNVSMFYNLVADYSNSDAVVLKVDQTRSFTDIDGLDRNQNAAAGALQSMANGNPLRDALGYLTDPNEAKNAYSQLAGDIHASAQSMAIEDSRFVREAALNRVRNGAEDANQSGLTWWSRGFGSKGRFDGTASDSASDLSRSIGGGFAGVDTAVGDGWRVGALAGYSHSNFNTRWADSDAQVKSYHVGLYGGGQAGFLDVRLGASYSWQKIDTSRGISFTGYSDTLSARYDSQITQLFGEVSHRFDVKNVALEPFVNLAYVHLHTDGFTEKGGAAALHGDASNADTLFTTIGLRASTAISADGATRLYGSAGWRYAYNDLTPYTALNFAAGSDGFSVAGVPIARNVAALELGIDRKVTNNLSFGISYVGQISSHTQDHGAKATLELKF